MVFSIFLRAESVNNGRIAEPLLQVNELKTYFLSGAGTVPAVDGITFHINEGEILGMVGESGCGKSVASLSIMRLVPKPFGKIVSGQIIFQGEDLVNKTEEEMRKIRGNKITMIFQEPMTSLNPIFTVGSQISEALRLHQGMNGKQALERTVELLNLVGIAIPRKRVKEYPHQLSGGLRQRVMIAMALSCNPKLLIADEPTTALDVTIQAQILELMKSLREKLGMSVLFISHDINVISEMADRVVVMYAGKIMEEASTRKLFHHPKHPYTKGLLASIPRIDSAKKRLHVIEGFVPNPTQFPSGCRFHPRCGSRRDICRHSEPDFLLSEDGSRVSCWLYSNHPTWEAAA